MLHAKLFVAAGILLLAEGTPGPQFKPTRGFVAPEDRPVDFKDMIIKKLLIRLNEALRNRGPPGHIPQPQQLHNLQQPQFQQSPQGSFLSQAPQQIISHQQILPPQQPILQQQVSRKHIIQQQIAQRPQVQQLPPPPLLQQPQQARPLLPPKGPPQFIHNCELQQQPFGNDIPGAFQYEYEEVPCPCCQCGGGIEEIPCSFCQGLQYEEIACPCCEQQQQQIEECPLRQRPLPFNEIQPPSGNQNRQQFPQHIHANAVAPAGLSGTRMIPGRPIFKETFVSPISSSGIDPSEAKMLDKESKVPTIKCPLSQAPLPQLPPPSQCIPELQQHCPQTSPQPLKAVNPQLNPQVKPHRPQQSSPVFIVPERVQVQSFVPHALHPSFFTGFSPEDEPQPGERIVHEGQFMSPKFKEILQASSRDAC